MSERFVVGLDLGQTRDYTALAVLERVLPPPALANDLLMRAIPRAADAGSEPLLVRHLDRVRDVPYTEVVDRVRTLLAAEPLAGNARLVIDRTGVGRAVYDLFVAGGLRPIGVDIHGGREVTGSDYAGFGVPKRDLVGALVSTLQGGRLKVARQLPLAAVFATEAQNFRMTINPETVHDSYSHWREGEHDDLLLAVGLSAWWATRKTASRVMVTW